MGGEGTDPAQSAVKNIWSKSTISRIGERFCDGQYSLVSFLFAVLQLTVSPCPAICKSGGAHAPVPHGVGATVIFIIRGIAGRSLCEAQCNE